MFDLALDCSTAQGSLALGWRAMDEPPVTYWEATFTTGRGQGGKLFGTLREAAELVREHGDPLERIIIGLGPGSYSGVRQAIAAGVGLAAATGARLVGAVSAAALDVGEMRYQAVGDARRGTFYYTAVEYRTVGEYRVSITAPELLEDQAALRARLAEHDGWPVFAMEGPVDGLRAEVAWPTAERLLLLPTSAHAAPPLEPIYLRPVAFTLPK